MFASKQQAAAMAKVEMIDKAAGSDDARNQRLYAVMPEAAQSFENNYQQNILEEERDEMMSESNEISSQRDASNDGFREISEYAM